MSYIECADDHRRYETATMNGRAAGWWASTFPRHWFSRSIEYGETELPRDEASIASWALAHIRRDEFEGRGPGGRDAARRRAALHRRRPSP